MKYKESLDFLFSQLPMFSRVGAAAYKPGLETSLALDNYFGNPHRKFRSIHVGGTNGKGSTSHNLASVLQAQGYKVGLYTSPHLADFRERMRVNGEMIPKRMVVDFVERWRKCGYAGHPSFFELTMMMAFDWFAKEGVDYAVIEVGMGGRLDSTNIITPIGCVITNISPDHMQFLGDTLEKIAAEKAGIIKSGIPVVIGEASGGVRKVFAERAAEVGAPIEFAQDAKLISEVMLHPEGGLSALSPLTGQLSSPLGGEYQIENLNTVLHAIEMLRGVGVEISDANVKAGLEEVVGRTGLMGRWMVMDQAPFTVCDTGHNLAGLTCTMHQLGELYDSKLSRWRESGCEGEPPRVRMVIGFVNDKDVEHISHLLPKDAVYYVTRASVPRAMPAAELLEMLRPHCRDMKLFEGGVAEAFAAASEDSEKDDIIYVGGSTFIVADYLASIRLEPQAVEGQEIE